MLNIIIFSRNRAAQLDLLLHSIKEFWPECLNYCPKVIWFGDNDFFVQGYKKLKGSFQGPIYIEQNHPALFKEMTVAAIDEILPYTVFFVDDLVFKEPFILDCEEFHFFQCSTETICLSLRLSPSINYCYTMDIDTQPPVFKEKLKIWDWKDYRGDWAYPQSLDGHIFRTTDIIDTIKKAPFDHPGSLENALLTSIPDRPKMICFEKSKIFNIPINRVGPYPNRHGKESPYLMNHLYLMGKHIDLNPIKGFKNTSCHQEINLIWI